MPIGRDSDNRSACSRQASLSERSSSSLSRNMRFSTRSSAVSVSAGAPGGRPGGASAPRSAGIPTCVLPSLPIRRGHFRALARRRTLSALIPRRAAASSYVRKMCSIHIPLPPDHPPGGPGGQQIFFFPILMITRRCSREQGSNIRQLPSQQRLRDTLLPLQGAIHPFFKERDGKVRGREGDKKLLTRTSSQEHGPCIASAAGGA